MTRATQWVLGVVAAILTGAFLSGVTGGRPWSSAGDPRTASEAPYFHGGKLATASVGDGGCRGAGCHVAMPHAKDLAEAAFRNMHVRFVDCVVCHARDSRKSWTVVPSDTPSRPGAGGEGALAERWKITAPMPAVAREQMHGILGAAVPCRGCHSGEGSREIAARGGKGLPARFVDPVALRMIEGGATQWMPDTMR